MDYTDTEVANIIKRYVNLMRAREFYFNNVYGREVSSSNKRTAIENIEKAMNELKKVTSIELCQVLPINLRSLEEMCKQVESSCKRVEHSIF
ncbi:MAG: hypothetical protein AABX77_00350 [Nanoarchaeota archaeon]